ncbi:MAG: FAD-dependent monooxygenase [Lapillicoccus sp.]
MVASTPAAVRDGDGSVRVYVCLQVPEEWALSGVIDPANPARARAWLLRQLKGWSPELTALVQNAGAEIVPRPIHVLPVGHRWPRAPGATLLGDAAHLISPAAGEGANLAMLDGSELALALVAQLDDIDTALGAYEADMGPECLQLVKSAKRREARRQAGTRGRTASGSTSGATEVATPSHMEQDEAWRSN